MKYNHKKIEAKWQQIWAKNKKSYQADEFSKKPKFYCLDMFPYPSGDGLHVGHIEGYTASDIYARYLRMNGKNVLHPMGWDAFGLPAENYAIKTGVEPAKSTQQNIKNFTKQIKDLGLSYDWSREIDTSDPSYYKWTQWFFLFLYKNGLAYRKKAKVNWCESCKTVLANEQVEDGVCERCKNEVVQKDLEQWFFKITDFIEDQLGPPTSKRKVSGLISGLDKIDWPESTKIAQKNWIGRSEGAIIKFPIKSKTSKSKKNIPNTKYQILDTNLEVFTTRLDTIYGCTYCVIAPENELIQNLKDQISNWKEVEKYINQAKKKTDLQRTDLAKEKTGVEIKGIKTINPFSNEEVPIFVADYVLSTYGTGAVMAVPSHDERDWEFVKIHKLKKLQVIDPIRKENISSSSVYPSFAPHILKGESIESATNRWKEQELKLVRNGVRCYTGDGELINSGEYSKLTSETAREEMAEWLQKNNLGGKKTTYKLRDWLISRQRYWGAPIPMIHCEKCGWQQVAEKDLPVLLPKVKDYRPKGTSPLGTNPEFVNTTCPRCKGKARRETDTMDTFVCSSWYYFRFADPENKKEFASREKIKKWFPVDLYIGGKEHTVLHLLYSRFFTKALYKYNHINFDEPFTKLRHQGIVLAEDGRKMSKSLGNVINPDEIVKEYGADVLRLYEMFMGPLEEMKSWNTKSIIGLRRFLERIFEHLRRHEHNKAWFKSWCDIEKWKKDKSKGDTSEKLKVLLNKTIKKVTEDIKTLHFNTAISSMMIFLNELYKTEESDQFPGSVEWEPSVSIFIRVDDYEKFLLLLSPFAPHVAEELWESLGHKTSIFLEKWPHYNEKLIKDEEITLVIQINGKVRDQIKVAAGVKEGEAKKLALGQDKVIKYIQNKKIKKIIFIQDRLINFVI